MNGHIQFAIHPDGFVVSRRDRKMAWPVLDFPAIGMGGKDRCPNTGKEGEHEYPKGNFTGPFRYDLMEMDLYDVREYSVLLFTKKIPLEIKNYHRKFWGMKPVGPSTWSKE